MKRGFYRYHWLAIRPLWEILIAIGGGKLRDNRSRWIGDNVRGEKRRRPAPPPTLDLLETCWRLKTVTGRVLSYGIYRTDALNLEVGARLVTTIDRARLRSGSLVES